MGEETAWLTQDQMATLFDRDKSVISLHLKNIFKEHELNENSVVAKFATTAANDKSNNRNNTFSRQRACFSSLHLIYI